MTAINWLHYWDAANKRLIEELMGITFEEGNTPRKLVCNWSGTLSRVLHGPRNCTFTITESGLKTPHGQIINGIHHPTDPSVNTRTFTYFGSRERLRLTGLG